MVEAASGATRAVNRKTRTGTVVSDKGDQTVIVAIERAAPHRLYHKVIRRTKRYPVHDPENAATVGDVVRIEECRPISKTKRWRLVEIVQEREVAQVAAAAIDAALVSEVQRSAARAAEDEGETPVAAAEPSGQGAEDAGGTTEASSGAVGVETEAPEAAAAPIGDEAAGDEPTTEEDGPEQQQ
jgi:small subunit ribosomal protein S17